jgi:urease accessory protein
MDTLALLRFHQLFDSGFPTGAFAQSGGLETYAQQGLTPGGLRELLVNNLALGYGRLDLAAAALAHDCYDDPAGLSALGWRVDAAKVIEGPRKASLQMGNRVGELMRHLYPDADVAFERQHYCVVTGAAAAWLHIPLRDAVAGLGQSLVQGSLAAATRSMRLGAIHGQSILTALQPVIRTVVDEVLADPENSMFTSTPGLDLRAHEQTTLYSRMFQS